MEIFNRTEKKNLKAWEMTRKAVLLTLFCFPAQVWAQQAGIDVGKYQDDLNNQIDQLKSGTSQLTPMPTPTKAKKTKKESLKQTDVKAEPAKEVKQDESESNSQVEDLSKRLSMLEKGDGFKWRGDIRVRSEYFTQNQTNTAGGPIADRLRIRLRFRLGADKKLSDEVTAGFRVVTDEKQADPTSSNQTLLGLFTDKSIYLDQGFITWTPRFTGGLLAVTGGKMPNPLTITPITWDEDVNPEGGAAVLKAIPNTSLKACYFILNENAGFNAAFTPGTDGDQYLLDFQAENKVSFLGMDVTGTLGYQYVPWVTSFLKSPPASYTGPKVNSASPAWFVDANGMVANPSTGLIPDLQVGEVLLTMKHSLLGSDIKYTLHWAHNFNSFGLNGGNGNNENAFFAKAVWGAVVHQGDWAGSIEWGYIEPNAVLSLFSDSDSGSGYNNQKWIKSVVEYGLADGMSFKTSIYGVQRVNYLVLGAPNNSFDGTSRQPAFRGQFDFNVKF